MKRNTLHLKAPITRAAKLIEDNIQDDLTGKGGTRDQRHLKALIAGGIYNEAKKAAGKHLTDTEVNIATRLGQNISKDEAKRREEATRRERGR